jgi:undecaprenyl-diphosphatase
VGGHLGVSAPQEAISGERGRVGRLLSWIGRIGQSEWRNLLLLAALAIWGLAELTDEVLEGETKEFDRRIMLALCTPGDLDNPIGPRWVEEMARDAIALGGILVACLASVGAFIYLL